MHAPRINSRTPQKGDLKMFFRIVRAITNRIIRVINLNGLFFLCGFILGSMDLLIICRMLVNYQVDELPGGLTAEWFRAAAWWQCSTTCAMSC